MCRLTCANSVLAMTTTTRKRHSAARLALMVPVFGGAMALIALITTGVSGSAVASIVVGPVLAVLAVLLYRLMVRFTERRTADELSTADARRHLPGGVALGVGLFAAALAVIALLGGYTVTGWGSVGGFVATLGMMTAVAVSEELLFRGVLFRLVEEKTGTWVALAVSGVLFGALHLLNPGATVVGAAAIAVEAGLMLGAAYVATRSLWLPIALHLGWNLAEGGIFGTTVSGSDATPSGLVESVMHGPALLTGGEFGPEASMVTVVAGVVATVVLLRKARRDGLTR
jgi:uncharacterized protein